MSENLIESERLSNFRETSQSPYDQTGSLINTPLTNNWRKRFIPCLEQHREESRSALESVHSSIDADVPNEDIDDSKYQTPYQNNSFVMRAAATPASAVAPTPSDANEDFFQRRLQAL